MKVLAASLRVGFCDEWKRGFKVVSTVDGGINKGLSDAEDSSLKRLKRVTNLLQVFQTQTMQAAGYLYKPVVPGFPYIHQHHPQT